MSGLPTAENIPGSDEVSAQLDRMIASKVFSESPQLVAFLRFVVEAALSGKPDRITAYTIGTDALGRNPNSFDPQTDPAVRVEATRLRRAIQRYYSGPGVNDSIVIDLPVGSYVPTFRCRKAEPDTKSTAIKFVKNFAQKRPLTASFAALAVVATVVIGTETIGEFVYRWIWPTAVRGVPPVADSSLSDEMPTLAIEVVAPGEVPKSADISAKSLTAKLQNAAARFDAITVVAGAPGDRAIDYRLEGFVEYHGRTASTVSFRLLDMAGGKLQWAQQFDRPKLERLGSEAEALIVAEIATALLRPFGVIRSLGWRNYRTGLSRNPRYDCILEASNSFRSFEPVSHARARACLEKLTTSDPSFAAAWPYLAGLYIREYFYGLENGSEQTPALDRALMAARRGIELSPGNARAYHLLMAVEIGRKDTTGAFSAGGKAMALNPYDLVIHADYGGWLILSGEIERGLAMMKFAAQADAVRLERNHFHLFVANYLKENLLEANLEAQHIVSRHNPLGFLARSLAAAASGDLELARKEYAQLVALRPAWRDDPEGELGRFIPDRAIVDRFRRDLIAAGLVPRR
jgi:tetratricopeptide (TPR) repeat protein